MLSYLKRHHIGLIALFIALGGTTYAATQLPANSVGTAQIRTNAVTPAKLSPALRKRVGNGGTQPKGEAPWRDPTISAAIKAAGQTVVSQVVLAVPAKAPWVETGLSITSAQHLWIDTRTDGRWSGNPSHYPYSDADGLPVYQGGYRVDANAPVESLIGFIGSSPPTPREVSIPVGAPPGGPGGTTNPGFVEVGNELKSFAPKTTGAIWLRNNDNTNYLSDVGKQIARVIVTSGGSGG